MTSWKTTLLGLASLGLAIASIFTNAPLSGKLQAVAGVVAGSGLVVAKDNSKVN